MKTLTTLMVAAALGALLSGCPEEGAAPCDPNAIGTICTIAGSGENGYNRDADANAIPALEARFSLPQDALAAPDGSLYILDWNNHRIRQLGTDGLVHWIAGRGELGGTLDEPAGNDFNHPTNVIFDQSGTHLVIAAWHNSKIRTIDIATGMIADTCGDGRRTFYWGDEGPALMASLDLPASVALDPAGNLVIMDQANQVLRSVDAAGTIHHLAGRCIIDSPVAAGGPGPCATGVEPVQCPPSPTGAASGKWTCGDPAMFCMKPCTPGYFGDDGPATEMRMSQPFGQTATPAGRIIYDGAGNLYFADTVNNLIRMIDTAGVVHRVAGRAPVGGASQSGYEGDGGPATDALLNYPVDVAVSDEGTIYFTDVRNHCVRAIDPAGIITTAVGVCGEKGYAGDGGPANEARLNLPFGLTWADGRLYVIDTGNSVIRSVRLR